MRASAFLIFLNRFGLVLVVIGVLVLAFSYVAPMLSFNDMLIDSNAPTIKVSTDHPNQVPDRAAPPPTQVTSKEVETNPLMSLVPENPKKRVLGKLGQALAAVTIHAEPNTESRAYYKAAPYDYLVINQGPNDKWVKVLMQNGISGYADRSKIATLPYDVTQKETQTPSR